MPACIERIKKHATQSAAPLFLGAVLGFLIILPQLSFPFVATESYRGVNFGNYGEDDVGYYSKGKEILEGHRNGNYALAVGKDNPDPHGVFVEYVLVRPLRFFGLSDRVDISVYYTGLSFIGVIVFFWILSNLVSAMTGHRIWSLAAAFMAIGGYNMLLQAPIQASPFSSLFNVYGRPIMPLAGSIMFFWFFLRLKKAIWDRRLKDWVLLGLILGLLFYVYFYAWTYAFAIGALLALWYIASKDWNRLAGLFFSGLLALLLALPRIWQSFYLLSSVIGSQIAFFMGVQKGRSFWNLSKITLGSILLLIIVVFLQKRKKQVINQDAILLLAASAAGWVAMNQQLFSGRSVQPLHYFWYFIVPLGIITVFYCVSEFLNFYSRKSWLGIGACLVFVLVFSVLTRDQIAAAKSTLSIKSYAQQYGPIFEILDQDPEPGVVLVSDQFLGHGLSIYTKHDLFWGNALVFHTPITYMRDALHVYMYLNKKIRDNPLGFFEQGFSSKDERISEAGFYLPLQADIASRLFSSIEAYFSGYEDSGTYIHLLAKRDSEALLRRNKIVQEFVEDYSTVYENKGFNDLLKKHKVRYILWDKTQSPDWDLSFIPDLKLIAESVNLSLYRIN
ncbi:MAG: hypothetical protein HYY51_00900 [Candidatus Magasanikbacteria bacterium]|nr:hypothetical protein [Candidatus Magasanikbacteria bacterium]